MNPVLGRLKCFFKLWGGGGLSESGPHAQTWAGGGRRRGRGTSSHASQGGASWLHLVEDHSNTRLRSWRCESLSRGGGSTARRYADLDTFEIVSGPIVFYLSVSAGPGLLKTASERGKTKTGKRGGPGGGPAPRRHGWSSVPLNKAFFTRIFCHGTQLNRRDAS